MVGEEVVAEDAIIETRGEESQVSSQLPVEQGSDSTLPTVEQDSQAELQLTTEDDNLTPVDAIEQNNQVEFAELDDVQQNSETALPVTIEQDNPQPSPLILPSDSDDPSLAPTSTAVVQARPSRHFSAVVMPEFAPSVALDMPIVAPLLARMVSSIPFPSSYLYVIYDRNLVMVINLTYSLLCVQLTFRSVKISLPVRCEAI